MSVILVASTARADEKPRKAPFVPHICPRRRGVGATNKLNVPDGEAST